MFYLITSKLGREDCIDKNLTDIYTDGMNIDCGRSIRTPSNIQPVRNIHINCSGIGNLSDASVFADWHTAARLNRINRKH